MSPLTSLELFEGCAPDAVEDLAARLTPRHVPGGERLMREGEESTFFALVVEGELRVLQRDGAVERFLALAGPGNIVGELGLLARRPRLATVEAVTSSLVLTGGTDEFETLLDLPGVRDRISHLATARLAEDARPVPTVLPDGTAVLVRPLLRRDRAALVAAVRRASADTLRRRFFEGGLPSDRTIDYLVNVNYVDHFAWVVMDGERPDEGLAVGRYVRLREEPDTAEVAFSVADEWQGHGAGTLLLGAVGAAAALAGITRFTASMLADNLAMKAVFAKAGARFWTDDPKLVEAAVPVTSCLALLDPALLEGLQAVAQDLVVAPA